VESFYHSLEPTSRLTLQWGRSDWQRWPPRQRRWKVPIPVDDSTYTDVEGRLIAITSTRDWLAAQMVGPLEGAAFSGKEIDKDQARQLITQAQALLDTVQSLP
jgi:hypothetical protein